MQQLVTCRNCGIQSYVDTSLGIDQACPSCQAIIHSPQEEPVQLQPHPNQVQSQLTNPINPLAPQSGHLHPPASGNAPDSMYPTNHGHQSVASHHTNAGQAYQGNPAGGYPQVAPHVPEAPKPVPQKPSAQPDHIPTNSNAVIVIAASVGGGLLVILLVVAFLLSGANRNDADNTASNSPDNSNSNAASTKPKIADKIVNSAEQFESLKFAPLPNLAAKTAKNGSLAYDWKSGSSTTYRFNYSMQAGSDSISISGTNRLAVSRLNPSTFMDTDSLGGSGTGSCFFVHPDGLAVTCAHVIEGAEKIEVRYQGRWQTAKVVAVDAKNDLALIKVTGSQMPILPVSSSSDLELAQSIHIIGYPIQDVLGSSVKFNSGAITGFKTENGASEILFDANINPGNSGGPIIDQSGNVVGVASAMLQGEGLNSVAMGVQSNRVMDLLKANNIRIPVSQIDRPQDKNSELAKLTTPAVCLVKTTGRSGIQVLDHFTTLSLAGRSSETIHGQLLVDRAGEILKYDEESGGGVSLFLLSPSKVGIEKLSLYEGDKWQYRGVAVIAKPQTETTFIPVVPDFSIRGRFGVRGRGQRLPSQQTKLVLVLGMETVNYTKRSEDDNSVTFNVVKTVQSLETDPSADEFLSSRLTGTMKYDKVKRRISEMKLSGSMSSPNEKRLQSYKVTFNFSVSNGAAGSSGSTFNPKPRDNRTTYTPPKTPRVRPGTSGSSTTTRPRTSSSRTASNKSGIQENSNPSYGRLSRRKKLEEIDDARLHFRSLDMGWGVDAMAFSPDSKFLFCGKIGLRVFDLEKKELVYESERLESYVTAIAAYHDARRILVGDNKGKIRVIEYDEEGKLSQIGRLVGHDQEVSAISISPDDRIAFTGGKASARVWDLKKTQSIHAMPATKVLATYISPDKSNGMYYCSGKLVKLDLRSGKETSSTRIAGRDSAAFSADGKRLAIPSGYSVAEHNVSGGENRQFKGGETNWTVDYHPKSNKLFSGGRSRVHQWDGNNGLRMDEFEVKSGYVQTMAFSPDGKFIAATASSAGQSVFVYKVD